MNELFKEDYNKAEEKLFSKGYYVANMEYNKNEYELYNGDSEVVIDHLSLAQLIQLSKML